MSGGPILLEMRMEGDPTHDQEKHSRKAETQKSQVFYFIDEFYINIGTTTTKPTNHKKKRIIISILDLTISETYNYNMVQNLSKLIFAILPHTLY